MDLNQRLAALHNLQVPLAKPKLPNKPVYTGDFETDPFKYGQMIQPFAAGLYDGNDFECMWGRNPVARFFARLSRLPAGIIYFHNLGGFDFFWMLKYLRGETVIRNGRIVAGLCPARDGKEHELRDSYAIMPFALGEYKKDGKKVKLDIDMEKLKASNREANRTEIVEYLRIDCVSLYELCTRFRERFGNGLTIGTTAMRELRQLHDFARINDPDQDAQVRDQFYFGGRVQCFRSGIIREPFQVYDVNSMYPFVMRAFQHPIGPVTSVTQKIREDTCFVRVEGWNNNAFPTRTKAGLRFDLPYGIFGVSIHEYRTAIKYGLFKTRRIMGAYNFKLRGNFGNFVNTFYRLRKQAIIDGDEVMKLFYKYVLNSSYGKFAQDSSKYFDYQITSEQDNLSGPSNCDDCQEDTCAKHWRIDLIIQDAGAIIWKRSNPKPVFYNVATGCSITGAARSILMEAYANCTNPIYCDTDSLICGSLSGVQISDYELGSWKLEGSGTMAAIAGKKLYALFDGRECIKQANKGVKITPKDIRFLAANPEKEIEYLRDSPSLHIDGSYDFLKRRVRMTANANPETRA